MEKINGLDLFSGIGGIGLALGEWVRTVAYCEQDRYAQGVLLSRMQSGDIDKAPIWDDVKTLRGNMLPGIDIIFGGFPCQDISTAGAGKGLDGERSGLFFEISRLVSEIRPNFVFLENVAAITVRGLDRVTMELTSLGYDCRWTVVSAASVGANHRRERWFLLAYAKSERRSIGRKTGNILKEDGGSDRPMRSELGSSSEQPENMAHAGSKRLQSGGGGGRYETQISKPECSSEVLADANSAISGRLRSGEKSELAKPGSSGKSIFKSDWWTVEPNMGRVVNGLPQRVDRIRCLGNSVVPLQVKTAFKKLIGITPAHSAEREKR